LDKCFVVDETRCIPFKMFWDLHYNFWNSKSMICFLSQMQDEDKFKWSHCMINWACFFSLRIISSFIYDFKNFTCWTEHFDQLEIDFQWKLQRVSPAHSKVSIWLSPSSLLAHLFQSYKQFQQINSNFKLNHLTNQAWAILGLAPIRLVNTRKIKVLCKLKNLNFYEQTDYWASVSNMLGKTTLINRD
jgi:hypothetical protein